MANTPQAKKRIRRNDRRAEINGARVSRIRTFVKQVEAALAAGDKDQAKAAFSKVQPADPNRRVFCSRSERKTNPTDSPRFAASLQFGYNLKTLKIRRIWRIPAPAALFRVNRLYFTYAKFSPLIGPRSGP